MRCRRMSATIQTKVCLKKQDEMERYVKLRRKNINGKNSLVPNIISHICYKCPQGEDIKKNGGSDMDITEILGSVNFDESVEVRLRNLEAIREKCLGSENLELDLVAPIEDQEEEVKVCRDCCKEKPVTEFYRTRKGRGVDRACKACRNEEAKARLRRLSEEKKSDRIDAKTSDKEVKFGIEMGGRRVWVCQDCLRRYLKG